MTLTIELSAMRKAVTLRQIASNAITSVSNFFSLIMGEAVTNHQTLAVFGIIVGMGLLAFSLSDMWYMGVTGMGLLAYSSNVLRREGRA